MPSTYILLISIIEEGCGVENDEDGEDSQRAGPYLISIVVSRLLQMPDLWRVGRMEWGIF